MLYILIVTFLPYGSGINDSQSGIHLARYINIDCSNVSIMFYRKKEIAAYVRMAMHISKKV